MESSGGGGVELPDRATTRTGKWQLEVTANDSDAMDVDQGPSAELPTEGLTRTEVSVQLRDEGRQAVAPSHRDNESDREASMVHGSSYVAHHRSSANLAGPSTAASSLESDRASQAYPDHLEQPRTSGICSYNELPRSQSQLADPCSQPPPGTPTSTDHDETAIRVRPTKAPSDIAAHAPLTDLPCTLMITAPHAKSNPGVPEATAICETARPQQQCHGCGVLPEDDVTQGACRPSGSQAPQPTAHPATQLPIARTSCAPAPVSGPHRSARRNASFAGGGVAADAVRRRSQQGGQARTGDVDTAAARSGGSGRSDWWNDDNDNFPYTWAGAYGLNTYVDVDDDATDYADAGDFISQRGDEWSAAQGPHLMSQYGVLQSQYSSPGLPHPHQVSATPIESGAGPVLTRKSCMQSPEPPPWRAERLAEGSAAGPSTSTGRGAGAAYGYDTYDRLRGGAGPELVAWDTWSEDEEEDTDTTAEQFYAADPPKDIQGIPWERLQFNRSTYRQTRLRQYRNYTNVLPDDDGGAYRAELAPLCAAPRRGGTTGTPPPPAVAARGPPFFTFVRNSRAVQSNIVHFQLRNLVWATSPNDVFVVNGNCVNHWNHVSRKVTEVLNLSGGGGGGGRGWGASSSPLRALGRVQVSTICVSGDLVAAGGFLGELVVKRLSSTGAAAMTGPLTATPGSRGTLGGAGAAASAARGGRPSVFLNVAPTRHAGVQGAAHARVGAAGGTGDSKAAGGGGGALLYCARITASDNGITNGLEIFLHPIAGTTVLSANNDSQLRLFSAPAGEGALRPLASWPFDWAVNYATVRPGTAVAAVVGDDSATLLKDVHNGTTVARLLGHRDFSFAAAWHPGGVLLATGNQDTTALVWDVRRTDEPLTRLAGRMGAIRSLRFSPDGRFLAMSEPADFVHVYDVASGFQECQEHDFFGEIAGIAFTPDSSSLFVGVSDLTYASLMQLERQRCEW